MTYGHVRWLPASSTGVKPARAGEFPAATRPPSSSVCPTRYQGSGAAPCLGPGPRPVTAAGRPNHRAAGAPATGRPASPGPTDPGRPLGAPEVSHQCRAADRPDDARVRRDAQARPGLRARLRVAPESRAPACTVRTHLGSRARTTRWRTAWKRPLWWTSGRGSRPTLRRNMPPPNRTRRARRGPKMRFAQRFVSCDEPYEAPLSTG